MPYSLDDMFAAHVRNYGYTLKYLLTQVRGKAPQEVLTTADTVFREK